jgi:hypothetical protein
MPSAAPVIARNLFLILPLVAYWSARHDARVWLMKPCVVIAERDVKEKNPANPAIQGK